MTNQTTLPTTKKVLVIFDLIPERTSMAIVRLTRTEYKLLAKAHNYYANQSDYNKDAHAALELIQTAFSYNPETPRAPKTSVGLTNWADNMGLITDIKYVELFIHTGLVK